MAELIWGHEDFKVQGPSRCLKDSDNYQVAPVCILGEQGMRVEPSYSTIPESNKMVTQLFIQLAPSAHCLLPRQGLTGSPVSRRES